MCVHAVYLQIYTTLENTNEFKAAESKLSGMRGKWGAPQAAEGGVTKKLEENPGLMDISLS